MCVFSPETHVEGLMKDETLEWFEALERVAHYAPLGYEEWFTSNRDLGTTLGQAVARALDRKWENLKCPKT